MRKTVQPNHDVHFMYLDYKKYNYQTATLREKN